MREYGFAAVRTALQAQNQGLSSNRFAVAGQRLWFRLNQAVPWLARMQTPYAEWARPRPWELEPPLWEEHDRQSARLPASSQEPTAPTP